MTFDFIMLASDLADLDTRWPHEHEILNFARFRHEFANFEPKHVRSLPMDTRWTHDGHTIIPEAFMNDTRNVSFAYDVDANGMRRLDDVVKPS